MLAILVSAARRNSLKRTRVWRLRSRVAASDQCSVGMDILGGANVDSGDPGTDVVSWKGKKETEIVNIKEPTKATKFREIGFAENAFTCWTKVIG